MAKKTNGGAPTKIESVKHKDSRKNIPTEELRDFMKEDEQKPKVVLYPRDPSLDPQLVWKGKDEQDAQDLAVPAVPIYIQEKIHPQAIIEDFRRTASKTQTDQLDFFGDFNGLTDFGQKVDFYHHNQHWSNRMILGDSLLVMASLAEKEGLKGQVQTIYFDPPYGIKFGSNWQVSTRKRDVRDGKVEDATRQPEQIRAFRDTWKLGIHSYLAYLRDRFIAARDLLTESGSIFVQIGDENVHLIRSLLDETFGGSNFVSQIAFAKTTGFASDFINNVCDQIVWYAKSKEVCKFRSLYGEKKEGEAGASKYRPVDTIKAATLLGHDPHRLAVSDQLTSQGPSNTDQSFKFEGKTWNPPLGMHWKTTVDGLKQLSFAQRIFVEGNSLRFLRFMDDFPASPMSNVWLDIGGIQSRTDPKVYVVQTATEAVKRCLLMTSDPGDLVLDPTCGSGTTAYVAEQWGRRWITIDTSRVSLALARTRLMCGRFSYYLLADSSEGIKKEAEISGKMPLSNKTDGDIRRGFVYERVLHVTLKSIANNPDIKEGMTRKQIDEAIARHADTETLYDRPYEDKKRLRVTGPFTVESLSPHRTISVEEKKQRAEGKDGMKITTFGPDQFGRVILENLRKAGVQNTIKKQRLIFDSIEPYAGEWIHGEGRYTESGKERRAAICIGPEYGTVGPELVKQAAKEAVKGVGFDVLVICGFAFDPHVSEETTRYGNLTVMIVRMNPDLAMGDELLKKTGAGNLFMVFGEPDMKIETQNDGKLVVEIKGLDVYDPTTGDIRSHSTDDIACWFIDTDYNDESFFIRHAYFTGADQPYEKLKNALRAEVDQAAWSQLYATRSRPFDKPKSGKIAVKVINHYGDEVLKVYTVGKGK
ncbi:MAG: site-specific DNA-methyltransferase [Phycisphaerales bacterium]|nr:site-specific DNA-methyltransferase [Phycisphaerales bacterium]